MNRADRRSGPCRRERLSSRWLTAAALGGLLATLAGTTGADAAGSKPAQPVSSKAVGSKAAVPAVAPALSAPNVSGLGWRSGASCADSAYAAWRGRALDSGLVFVNHASWDTMLKGLKANFVRKLAQTVPQPVVSLALLPHSAAQQHAACAQGQFDAYYRQFGTLLTQGGLGRAVVRLGWEPGEGSHSHPWGIDSAAQIPDYIGCFRSAAKALKSTAPDVKIEWNNSKRGKLPAPILSTYPGDDVVDIWGLNSYNFNPVVKTQADWDGFYNAMGPYGNPLGLGPWLKAAASHGKQLAVSEWGVWNRSGLGPEGTDQPVYITNMFQFFKEHAANIAYDNYYNCPSSVRLFPNTDFPKAAAAYRQAWSGG